MNEKAENNNGKCKSNEHLFMVLTVTPIQIGNVAEPSQITPAYVLACNKCGHTQKIL